MAPSRTPSRSAQQRRIEEQSALWALVARVLAGVLGLLIIMGLAVQYFVVGKSPDFLIAALAVALSGPVVGQTFAAILAAARSGSVPPEG